MRPYRTLTVLWGHIQLFTHNATLLAGLNISLSLQQTGPASTMYSPARFNDSMIHISQQSLAGPVSGRVRTQDTNDGISGSETIYYSSTTCSLAAERR